MIWRLGMSEGLTSEDGVAEPSHIPNPSALRIDDSKITDYLLNETHSQGRSKASFFRAVGFANPNIDSFKIAMRNHARTNPIANYHPSPYGTKTIIECQLLMPNGKTYCIRSVWIDHNDGLAPRLITAHPLG
jgi:hypothetical protein